MLKIVLVIVFFIKIVQTRRDCSKEFAEKASFSDITSILPVFYLLEVQKMTMNLLVFFFYLILSPVL